MKNPLMLFYYLKEYYGEFFYEHRIGFMDCLQMWWIIE